MLLKYRFPLFIVFLSHFILSAQVKYENDSIIIWNKERKINWDDFKSTNKINAYVDAKAVVNTSLAIYPRKFNCLNIHLAFVVAQMKKDKSWVKIKDDYLLTHEQTHFDITELFVRKVRKEINKMININMHCNIDDLYKMFVKYLNELNEFQKLYDEETNHGLDVNAQLEWNDKIQVMLDQYKDFEIDINIDDLDLD